MDRLPLEILCGIFLLTLPYPIHPRTYDESRGSVTMPLRISHVCRTWRRVSLSFGELWSYLNFFSCKESTTKVFDTWLWRTNGAPLSFRVECNRRRPSDGAVSLHRSEHVISTLLSQQHRWREINLAYGDIHVSPEFPRLDLKNMPMLESLTLITGLRKRTNINIAQSTRLRRLLVHCSDFDLETGGKVLHYLIEQAEFRFHYDMRPSTDILRIWLNFLKVAPNLKHFSNSSMIRDSPPPFRPDDHPEPRIILRNLLTLVMRMGPDSYLLDYLTLPNLRDMYFIFDPHDDYNAKRLMVVTFFQRSLPPLTKLCVDWYRGNEDILLQILPLLPTLKYLVVSGLTVSERFFDTLTVKASNPGNEAERDPHSELEAGRTVARSVAGIRTVSCPTLESLFLRALNLEEDCDPCSAFIAMLKSRAKTSEKFRNVYYRDGNSGSLFAPLVVTEVDLLDELEEENISEFQRNVKRYLVEPLKEVIVGRYDVVEFYYSNES